MEWNKMKMTIAFLLLAVVAAVMGGGDGAATQEEYWKAVLPASPMPPAIKRLLPGDDLVGDSKAADVNVGYGGVGVNTPRGTHVGVSKGGVAVGTRTRTGRPIFVGVHPGPDPFNYEYAASETQIHDDPNVALFFLEGDLYTKGKTMNLDFSRGEEENQPAFIPRRVADSIPFSSEKLPEILKEFSVKPDSKEAESMRKTLRNCEDKPARGEAKFCATSLESMLDFSVSRLGKKVVAVATNAAGGKRTEYRVDGVRRRRSSGARVGKGLVVCHRQDYAYAVFLCHETSTTAAYEVDLTATDGGSKAGAVAVCHEDTAAWNPNHVAFRVLNVKPGSVPVCHFLPQDHIVWLRS